MARAHEIAIAADAKEFDQAIRSGVIKPTEEAADALESLTDSVGDVGSASGKAERGVSAFADKLVDAARKAGKSDDEIKDALRDMGLSAKQAERAVEGVGDEFKETGREGQRAGDKLEDALKDAQRESKDLGKAGRDAGDDVRKGMKRAEEGVDEFKDEAKQSIKETAASFSDITDAVDLVQEVAANAFAGFGPAGVAAGATAAVGIGAAAAAFESVNEAEEESRKRAAEWAQAYIEAGGKVLSAATTVAIGLDIATDPERYKVAAENAKNWGVDVSVAIAAMAGEAWALKAANDNLTESEQKIAAEMAEVGIQFDWSKQSMTDLSIETQAGRTALEQLKDEMSRGAEQADAYSRYLAAVADNTAGATTQTDEFGDRVTALPDGTTIYIDAETGQATTDVNAIEQKIYGVPDKTVHVGADTSEVDREITRLRRTTITIGAKVIKTAEELGWKK